MAARIVVVDDEPQIRLMLRIALKSEGYDVVEAENGERGLEAVARHQPDMVILDLGLPDIDGHEVLASIRQWSSVPVIILSVRASDSEKVSALDTGAQDYVTKPFSVEELLARVRASIRDRIKPDAPSVLDDGRVVIDLARRQVMLKGMPLELTPKEYAVLSRLAASPNCVITQAQLLEEIWGPAHKDDSHYLRIVVSHLRKKLDDDSSAPSYLRTEAGVGYRLLFAVDEVNKP